MSPDTTKQPNTHSGKFYISGILGTTVRRGSTNDGQRNDVANLYCSIEKIAAAQLL
jgi:hypothetical protein